MKLRTSIFLFSILCPFLLSAKLTFKKERIVHEATLEEKEYEATFSFTNEGDTPIKILEVNSSCGCTTALPSKQVFGPGESGEITATFDYGQREGKQIKSIRVETDQEKDSRSFLTLEVNIPSALDVSPSVVMWNRATTTEFEAKEVTIDSQLTDDLEIMDVVASSEFFGHEIKVIEKGKKFTLSIKPQNLPDKKGIIRGTFIVKTSYSNPLKGNIKVYAIVR